MSITELSEATALHPNTVREHLNILIAAHFVSSQSDATGGRGRPKLSYQAVDTTEIPQQRNSQEADSLTLLCRVLAAQAAETNYHPSTWNHVQDAARQWVKAHGEDLPTEPITSAADALATVERVLDRRGFSPVSHPDEQRVVLHACPYGELAIEQQQVICGAHLGLLLGVLESAESPVSVRFADIDPRTPRCVIELIDSNQQGEDPL
jgi:predicted ArsR family transcriptional regulator